MRSTVDIEARIGRRLALSALCLTLSACAATWSPRVERPVGALQWPPMPALSRLTLVESIGGFARGQDVGSVARAVAIGRQPEAKDRFGVPVAAAAGADGRLAVADLGLRCVHLFVPAERRYLRLVGSPEAPLISPVGVVFDEAQRLYVSDSTGRLLVFGVDGKLLATWSRAGAAALLRPTGLAWSRARKLLYTVDTLAHAVYAFDEHGALVRTIGGRGEGAGSFNFPTHVAWSPAGELFVTDALNFRVQIFDEDGRPRGMFGRHGDGSGDLAMPKGVAVDRRGVVYLADSLFDNVQLFDREGRYLLGVGARGVGLGEFWIPAGLSISERGDLYVADSYNRRVQVFHITERDADATP